MRSTFATVCLSSMLLLAGTALAADLPPDALVRRGLAEFREARYPEAAADLNAAADALLSPDQMQKYVDTGKFENLSTLETALVYLALAEAKQGHDTAAHDAILRVVTAERIEPVYAQLPLQAEAAEFETLVKRLAPGTTLTPNTYLARGGAPAGTAMQTAEIPPSPAPAPAAPAPSSMTATASSKTAEAQVQQVPAASSPKPPQPAVSKPPVEPPAQTAQSATPRPAAAPSKVTASETTSSAPAPVPSITQPTSTAAAATSEQERERYIEQRLAEERAKIEKAADERVAAERAAAQKELEERVRAERAAAQKAADERIASERAAAQKAAEQQIAAAQKSAQQQIEEARKKAEEQVAAAKQEAEQRIAAAQKETPRDYLARVREADSLAIAGKLDGARRLYAVVANAPDASREVLTDAAIGLYRTGGFRDAVNAFRRVAPFAKGEEDLRFYNAVSLFETGDYSDAKKELACALPYLEKSDEVTRYQTKIELTGIE